MNRARQMITATSKSTHSLPGMVDQEPLRPNLGIRPRQKLSTKPKVLVVACFWVWPGQKLQTSYNYRVLVMLSTLSAATVPPPLE